MTPGDPDFEARTQAARALRARRKELGMTQEQVARAIDVTLGSYRNWEAGRNYPDLKGWLALCDLFGWPVPDPFVENARFPRYAA